MRPGFPESGGLADRFSDIESRLGKLERAAQLPSASIGSGGLRVKDGGALTLLNPSDVRQMELTASGGQKFYAANGTTELIVLDSTRLRQNRADGTRQVELTPGGGLKIYAANGTTEQVVLDGDGLEVFGGVVRALDVASSVHSETGVTLTTTMSEKASFTVAVPSWVNQVQAMCWATVASDDGGFGPLGVVCGARIDDIDGGGFQSDTNGLKTQTSAFTRQALTTFGSTVKFSVYASRNGGSGNPTAAIVSVVGQALFLR